jgi:hypothetical protein
MSALLYCLVSCAAALNAAAQDDATRAVEEFKAKLKATAEPFEKAQVVRAFGGLEPKVPILVSPLITALAPSTGDPFLYVPTAAAEALGSFRSMAAASKALVSAAETYKRIPFLHRKLVLALGRVGHTSAMPLLDDALNGTDASLATLAIEAIGEMPAGMALEKLFNEYDRMDAKRKNAKDVYKAVYDRCQPEIQKFVKTIAAQPYPTFPELKIWWSKHGSEFKKESENRERERQTVRRESAPPLVVELLFKEGAGTVTMNSGASGTLFPSATLTTARPGWTGTTPPNGGPCALEWDKAPGPHAVDLGGGPGLEQLRNLKSFTVTGWFMCTDGKEGQGAKECGAGNRILSWLNPSKLEGVEVVFRSDASLQVGINEWAEASPVRSKPGVVHVYDPKEKDYGAEQFRTWCFFAVTYDAAPAHGQAKLYLGWRGGDARLALALDYDRGAVGPLIASHLTVGNVAPQIRPQAPDRNFRGIIDEVRIFASPRDGSAALPIEDLIRIQNR